MANAVQENSTSVAPLSCKMTPFHSMGLDGYCLKRKTNKPTNQKCWWKERETEPGSSVVRNGDAAATVDNTIAGP